MKVGHQKWFNITIDEIENLTIGEFDIYCHLIDQEIEKYRKVSSNQNFDIDIE